MTPGTSLRRFLPVIRDRIPLFLGRIAPGVLVRSHLRKVPPPEGFERPGAILSLGKAAGGLTEGLSSFFHVPPDRTLSLLPEGYPSPPDPYPVLFGTHPFPDESAGATLSALRAFLHGIPEDQAILVAISGGTSSLLADPVPPVTLADKASLTRRLMESGAPIGVLNGLRIHLSRIKGGGLAALLFPRPVLFYTYSDIPGNGSGLVGSSPLVAVPRDGEAALSSLRLWVDEKDIPDSVRTVLGTPDLLFHPDPEQNARFGGLIANAGTLLPVATEIFLRNGPTRPPEVRFLTDRLSGEAREAGLVLSSLILWNLEQRGTKDSHPSVSAWLASGETTVRLPPGGTGRGGRSLELGLSTALALRDAKALVLSLATDGWDGNSGLAGSLIETESLRDPTLCRGAMEALAAHNTGPFLSERGMAVETGPTGNNLNDLLLVLADPSCGFPIS